MMTNYQLFGPLLGFALVVTACGGADEVQAGRADGEVIQVDDSTESEPTTTEPPANQGDPRSTLDAADAQPATGYDRNETINELLDGGIDETTAICIVDGMEEELGVERLGERGDPTPEETELVEEITLDCVLG